MEHIVPSSQSHPTVDVNGLSFRTITADQATIDIDLQVENSQPILYNLIDIEFSFEEFQHEADQQKTIKKKIQYPYIIKPFTSTTMKVPVTFSYRDIKPLETSTENKKIIPYSMTSTLNFYRRDTNNNVQVRGENIKQFLTIIHDRFSRKRVLGFSHPRGNLSSLHFSSISFEEAKYIVELKVRNLNTIPVQLAYANITMESEGHTLLTKKIDYNMSVKRNSTEVLKVPIIISFNELRRSGMQKNFGQTIKFKLKMDFWFREYFYGMYTISMEKIGELPMPIEATTKLQRVAFDYNSGGKPCAKLHIDVDNRNEFDIKLARVQCDISHRDTKSLIGNSIHSNGIIIKGMSASMLEIEVTPLEKDIGSALWSVFSGKGEYAMTINMTYDNVPYAFTSLQPVGT